MKQEEDWRTTFTNTYETVKKTTEMHPGQLRAILDFLVTPTTTWLFEGYPYTTGIQKALKISNKNLSTGYTSYASLSTNLFTNSFDHISTNGKAPLHSHINLQHPTIPLFAVTKGYRSAKRQLSNYFTVVIQPLSTRLIKPNFRVDSSLA